MIHPILRVRKWHNSWIRKTRATKTAIKLTILAEVMMIFFLAWGFVPYWYELVKTETPVYAQTEQIKIEQMPETIKDTIVYYHRVFGVKVSLEKIYALIDCESQSDPERNGDYEQKLLSRGLMQFQPATFVEQAAVYGVKNPDINDWRDQVLIGMQMIRDGKIGKWTCGR